MEHVPPAGGETEPSAVEAAAQAAAQLAIRHDTLAQDSAGQVRPSYIFVPRTVGRLARGELAVEPVLGPVRTRAVLPESQDGAFVRVVWSDDLGPCRAAGRYRADRQFPVRVPDPADRLFIRQGLDRAARANRQITSRVARLIAAHIHLGPRSAIYRFAVRGTASDQLYDELNLVSISQPVYRPWAAALAQYCLDRDDDGPVRGWGPPYPLPASLPDPRDTRQAGGADQNRHSRSKLPPRPLTAKRVPVETAERLIEAAFALGVLACRTEVMAAKARWIIQQHALGRT